MKFFILITLLFLSYISSGTKAAEPKAPSQPTTIRLVSDAAYPPYMYTKNGAAVGIAVELVQVVNRHLPEYDIKVEATKWTKALKKVKSGEVQGILGPYFHAYDTSVLYPYSYPLLTETLVTVCRDDVFQPNQVPYWPNDYSGLKLGNIAGFMGWAPKGIKLRDTNTVNFFEFPTTQLALTGVAKEVVDCSIFEKTIYNYFLEDPSFKERVQNLPNVVIVNEINHQTMHIAYSILSLENTESLQVKNFPKEFDAKLIELLRTGKLDHVYKKYGMRHP